MRFLESKVVVYLSVALSCFIGYTSYEAMEGYHDVRLTATTFATLSATLFGFLMTSLSILIAVSDRDFVKNLRLTGHYKLLVSQLFFTGGILLVTLVVSVCAHILPNKNYQDIAIGIATGLLSESIFSFLIAGNKFKSLVVLLVK